MSVWPAREKRGTAKNPWNARRARWRSRGILVLAALLSVASVKAYAHAAAHTRRVCDVPRLTRLTLEGARVHAAHARCKLRVKGAPLEQAAVQTVERQAPASGVHASEVTVWLNPVCRGEADYGPGIQEPRLTVGPTKLVSGFYLAGGPLALFSRPDCKRPAPPPRSGVVEVINSSGVVVATKISRVGRFVEIPLPAGSYTIRGTFLQAAVNGAHPKRIESVAIPVGHTVRQDFVLSIP